MFIQNRFSRIAAWLVLAALVQPCLGQMEPGGTRSPDPKITEAAGKIQQTLEPLLTKINESKPLAAADILPGQGLLDEYKRSFTQMDDKQKAQYCMLQAWISYYQNDINTAFMNASRACKLDAANSDAWVTQVAMSILADKKPMLPRQPRPQRTRPSNPNNPNAMMGMGMEMETTDPSQQMMQPGKLNFDLNALLIDAIGLKIEGLNLTCLNGTTFKYEPGQESLCALVWQEHAPRTVSNEPNTPGRRRPQSAQPQPQPQPQPQMMEPMMMEPGMGGGYGMDMFGGGFGGDPFTAANMAYSRLFQMGLASGQVKFAAINLDAAAHKQKLIDDVVKRPWPWAVVMASDQQQKMPIELGVLQGRRPVLIMTDKEGTIRYAGPATGIIAPMLMGKVTSNGFSTFTAIEGQPALPVIAVDPNLLNKPTLTDSNSLPKAKPTVQSTPTVTPTTPAVTQQTQTQFRQLSEEEEIAAEQLLAPIRGLFMKTGQRRITSYKNAVDNCREIIRKYPGTKYAEEARQLLRQIPENQRSRYNITDEELGL
jgi:hypothetical protein